MSKWSTLLLSVLIMMIANGAAYGEREKAGGDDFISSTVSDVFDKLDQYSSGKKHILYSEEELNKEDDGYDRDALGRRVPPVTIKPATGQSPVGNKEDSN